MQLPHLKHCLHLLAKRGGQLLAASSCTNHDRGRGLPVPVGYNIYLHQQKLITITQSMTQQHWLSAINTLAVPEYSTWNGGSVYIDRREFVIGCVCHCSAQPRAPAGLLTKQ